MANHPLEPYLPSDILDLYEVHNYRNAAQVLKASAPGALGEIMDALRAFTLTTDDIRKRGGNESDIPKKLSAMLRPNGWNETRIKGDLVITKLSGNLPRRGNSADEEEILDLEALAKEKKGLTVEKLIRKNFLDGHKVDYVKKRVAFDVEWNSKDQTFDRDLYAFRAFHECDLIDAGILLTRSADLNEIFDLLGPELDEHGDPKIDPKTGKPKLIKSKYGASTTWMGKLLYRINAGRHGGCPVLVLGITRKIITDWKDHV
jgi:hypothetical protein